MPRTKRGAPPTYRLYKRTGQAVVTLDGIDHYLGPFGTRESTQKYNRLVGHLPRVTITRFCRMPLRVSSLQRSKVTSQ